MKARLLFVATLVLLIASCAPQADKVTGTYNGDYIYNSSTYYNIAAAVTKENDNTVTIAFSGVGIASLTVAGVAVAANGDNSSLSKSAGGETVSGNVIGNTMNVTYSGPTGNVSYVGTK